VSGATDARTLGVEEEFLLVDPDSGQPRAMAGSILRASDDEELTGELQLEQLETGTQPCRTLDDVGRELRRARASASDAAQATGVKLAPLGTSPLPVDPTVSPRRRYQRMIERAGAVGDEQLTCGCHVHVGIASEEEGVAALDRIRPWLATLLALSANSPFWNGEDSGYASFRSQIWSRWPSAGPTGLFGSPAGYHAVTSAMLATETILDDGMIYFDARLSAHQPTVEIRVADVCREPDDAVLIAGLVRALVETAVREWRAGHDPIPARIEVLRLASWQAGKSGLDGPLLLPPALQPGKPVDVLDALVKHVTPALEDTGDLRLVSDLMTALLGRGTGAARQREVFRRNDGDLRAVVADAAA
jgi:glutamate---cysteine ligase / carboxylate-amine ligase